MPRTMLSSRYRRARYLMVALVGLVSGTAAAQEHYRPIAYAAPASGGGDVFDRHLLGHSQPNCTPRGTIPYQPYAPQPYAPEPYSPEPGAEPAPMTPDQVFMPQPQGALLASADIAAGLSNVGYIDPAVPQSQFRLRFDAGYDFGSPDKAEFFYAKCGCFRVAGIDPNAPGPAPADGRPETNIDSFQDIRSYVEVATSERFSVFGEFPVRFLNPEVNDNTAGFADMNVGFKYALIACPTQFLTLQFRAYLPTGDAGDGLGTDHVSLEPGLLYFSRPTERLIIESEFKGWVPIDGTDFAGEILQYGIGAGYIAIANPSFTVTPTLEFVGWTILDGAETDVTAPGAVGDVSGETIVNIKPGVRIGWGRPDQQYINDQSLYIGYGTPITDNAWYDDIVRVEYRMLF